MRELARALLSGAAILLWIPLSSPPARACSVCLAGDPTFSEHGASVQQRGDFSIYVEVSGWKKRSGVGDHHDEPAGSDAADEEHLDAGEPHDPPIEEADAERLDVFLSWTPLDRLSLTLDVPFAFNEIVEREEGDAQSISESGIGDVSLSTSAVLWRNRDVLPSTWLEGRAFLKFPTGEDRARTNGVRDKHIQNGTGSWDFGFGVAGIHKTEFASLYASLFGRVNTEGSLDYEYGDVVLANLAAVVPLGHATGYAWLQPFTSGFELNYRWAARDVDGGSHFDDSGGSILYATPSLRIALPWFAGRKAPSLRAAVQIPFTSKWLYGFQHEDPRWSVGLQIPF